MRTTGMAATVRFQQLVARSGQPTPHVLWTAPGQDKAFKRALDEHRVLTVHQTVVGTKADHGEVGFSRDNHPAFLVFPKSLKAFAGKRVVGIKYALLEGAEEKPQKSKPAKPKKAPAAKRRSATPAKEKMPVFLRLLPDPPAKKAAARAQEKSSSKRTARHPSKAELARAIKELEAGDAKAAREALQRILESKHGR